MWRLGQRPALDGLRGVAILLVIASHVFAGRFVGGGPVGVTIFFVLSGFLITSLLLEERERTDRISLRRFYERRARRLFPALALSLLVVGSISVYLGASPARLLPVVFYFGNWWIAFGGKLGYFRMTWSLAVEEQFYLLWPLLLIGVARLGGRRAIMWTAVVGAALSIALRFALWDDGTGAQRIRFGSDTNAAGLMVGCALAVWMSTRTTGQNRPVTALAATVFAALTGFFVAPAAYTLVAPLVGILVAVVLILTLCQDGDAGPFASRFMRYAGRRSYGWYLWHVPALLLSVRWLGYAAPAILLGLGVTLAMAELSWRYVEQPFLRRNAPRREEQRPERSPASALTAANQR